MGGTGFSIGGSLTAGESFTEYKLLDVTCEEHIYPPFPTSPEEDWPVLFYHVTFQRSWQPYVRGYVVLQIILNLASFCCFWLPPHVGERMSLSITSVLAAVASELVITANLPAAAGLTWFAKFSLMSTLFTAGVLFESAAVIYFHYCTANDLCPAYIRWLQKKWRNYFKKKLDDEELSRDFSQQGTPIDNEVAFSKPEGKDEEDISTFYDSSPVTDTGRRLNAKQQSKATAAPSDKPTGKPLKSSMRPASPQVEFNSLHSTPNPMSDSSKVSAMDDSRASVKFKFEPNSDGDIEDVDDPSRTSYDNGYDERAQAEEDEYADAVTHTFGQNSSSKRNLNDRPSLQRLGLSQAAGAARERRESSVHKELMKSFRTRKNIKTIMGRDADDFKNAEEMENNVRWQQLAKSIDDAARVLFPAAFFLFLAITFSGLDRHG